MNAARALHAAGVDVRPQLTSIADAARPHDLAATRDIVRIYDHFLREFSPTPAGPQ